MAQSIKIMFAVAIFITYALQAYVPVEIMWNTYLHHRIQNRKILWEYVCRTLVTLATCKYNKRDKSKLDVISRSDVKESKYT